MSKTKAGPISAAGNERFGNKPPPTQKQLERAAAMKVWLHPNWCRAQVQAAINWADPAYRAARAAGHRKSMARLVAGEGFLYLAEVIGTEEIKIGHALNPTKRVTDLWTDDGKRCRLIASTPASLTEERRLHYWLRRWLGRAQQSNNSEYYPRTVLAHDRVPACFRSAA